jgi:hypothetical protein
VAEIAAEPSAPVSSVAAEPLPKSSILDTVMQECGIGAGFDSFDHGDQVPSPGLPDISWYNIPKRGRNYQIAAKYSKWLNIPNGSYT